MLRIASVYPQFEMDKPNHSLLNRFILGLSDPVRRVCLVVTEMGGPHLPGGTRGAQRRVVPEETKRNPSRP